MNNLDIQVGDRVTYRYVNEEEQKQERIAVNMDEIFWLGNTDKEILKIERIGENGWYTVYEKKELLTDEEREFLKQVLKFGNYKEGTNNGIVKFIIKKGYFIYFHYDEWASNTIYIDKNLYFRNLKGDKKYTLKELGLEEEV